MIVTWATKYSQGYEMHRIGLLMQVSLLDDTLSPVKLNMSMRKDLILWIMLSLASDGENEHCIVLTISHQFLKQYIIHLF